MRLLKGPHFLCFCEFYILAIVVIEDLLVFTFLMTMVDDGLTGSSLGATGLVLLIVITCLLLIITSLLSAITRLLSAITRLLLALTVLLALSPCLVTIAYLLTIGFHLGGPTVVTDKTNDVSPGEEHQEYDEEKHK